MIFDPSRFNFGRSRVLGRVQLLALERMLRKRDLCPWSTAVRSSAFAATGPQVEGLGDGAELVCTTSRDGAEVTATIVAPLHTATAQNVGTFAAVTAENVLALTLPAVPGVHATAYDIAVPFAGTEDALGEFIATLNANEDFSYALLAQDNGGGKVQFVSKFGGSLGFSVLASANGSDADVLASLGFTDNDHAAVIGLGTPNVGNTHSLSLTELAALAVAAGIPCSVGTSPSDPTKSDLVFPVPRGQTADFTGEIAEALGLLASGQSLLDHSATLLGRPLPMRVGRRMMILP